MATTLVQIRMDEDLKAQATSLFEDLGLDMTTAIRMFLKKAVMHEGLPFDVQRENQNHEPIHTDD